MKFRVFIILIAGLAFSCKAKDSTSAGVKNDLENAMQTFLYSSVNYDSTAVKYHVKDVVYYEDTDKYICEFTVNLKEKLFDTTGIMKANISKDFKKVNRLY